MRNVEISGLGVEGEGNLYSLEWLLRIVVCIILFF